MKFQKGKNWRALIYAVLRVALAVWGIVFVLLFMAQEKLIFPGSKLPPDHKFQFSSFEEKTVTVDGLRIDSLLFHAPDSKGLILHFHGNGGDLDSWGDVGERMAKRVGMDVWMVDYPGYGKSEGRIASEQQLHDIAEAFFNEATKLGAAKIIIYGCSIGTGIATRLASRHQAAALILEAPYFSLKSVAGEKAPWAPLFLLKYTFRSDRWIAQVRSPVLVFHGEEDEVIPFHQGKDLSALVPNSVFVPIKRGHHNDLSEFPEYWNALEKFVSSISAN